MKKEGAMTPGEAKKLREEVVQELGGMNEPTSPAEKEAAHEFNEWVSGAAKTPEEADEKSLEEEHATFQREEYVKNTAAGAHEKQAEFEAAELEWNSSCLKDLVGYGAIEKHVSLNFILNTIEDPEQSERIAETINPGSKFHGQPEKLRAFAQRMRKLEDTGILSQSMSLDKAFAAMDRLLKDDRDLIERAAFTAKHEEALSLSQQKEREQLMKLCNLLDIVKYREGVQEVVAKAKDGKLHAMIFTRDDATAFELTGMIDESLSMPNVHPKQDEKTIVINAPFDESFLNEAKDFYLWIR